MAKTSAKSSHTFSMAWAVSQLRRWVLIVASDPQAYLKWGKGFRRAQSPAP